VKRSLALIFFAACTVPDLDQFGKKACDLDGGHACVDGYVCQGGFCVVANGGPCTMGQQQACGNDKGECKQGAMKCLNGMFGPCEGAIGPTAEICDGKDNDCDGMTDEDLVDTTPCEKSKGVCMGKFHACVMGHYESTCTGASYGPDYQDVESLCDNLDNDCNGQTDEGGAGACPDAGVCAGHVLACMSGMAGMCSAPGYEPIEMTCDGLDNDCNGLVDEGLVSSTPCGLTQGVCAGKHEACVDGGYESVCTAASYGPKYEVVESSCDGLDNDCDGRVDTQGDGGTLRSTMLCELQLGVCSGAKRACVDGGFETPCTKASYGPTYSSALESTCDGLDNDCDGEYDWTTDRLLVGGPGAQSHLALANDVDTFAYEDSAAGPSRVYFHNPQGRFQISESASMSSSSPAIAKVLSNLYAVGWQDTTGAGTPRLQIAGVAPDAGVQWSTTLSNGQGVFAGPRIAATPAANDIAVVWVDATSSTLQGAMLNSAGSIVSGPITVAGGAPPDGGANEQVFAADVAARGGGVYVGWAALQGGKWYARFRPVTAFTAGQLGAITEYASPATVFEVRVSGANAGWIAAGTTGGSVVQTVLPDAGAGIVANVTGTAASLAVVNGATFWVEDGTHLKARSATGVEVDMTPATGMSLGGTEAANLSGAVLVGYEIDKGAGDALDLDFQSICLP
jgi:hypothetical protein